MHALEGAVGLVIELAFAGSICDRHVYRQAGVDGSGWVVEFRKRAVSLSSRHALEVFVLASCEATFRIIQVGEAVSGESYELRQFGHHAIVARDHSFTYIEDVDNFSRAVGGHAKLLLAFALHFLADVLSNLLAYSRQDTISHAGSCVRDPLKRRGGGFTVDRMCAS